MICWVRSATRTASSVGSASASSKLLVCSDWVPPSTPASASIAVRTTLLSGCWAVSDTPAVWGGQPPARGRGVEAHQQRALVARAERVAQLPRPDPPRRAVLRDLLEEID